MGKKKDLSLEERMRIEISLADGKSIGEIAKLIGRHYQTVYKELKRCASQKACIGKYSATESQEFSNRKKRKKGRRIKIGNDSLFIKHVETMILKLRYSPEAVLLDIKKRGLKFDTKICRVTLYKYIEKGIFGNISNSDLPVKRDRKKKINHVKRIAKTNKRGKSIEDRPKEISARQEFGHWEMDTVVGKRGGSKACLLVLTERKSRLEHIIKIADKTQASVCNALDNLERAFGKEAFSERFKTITCDNGVEFLDSDAIERSVFNPAEKRTSLYFCHAYSSSERGSNENQNRMIRRWIPKGTDMDLVSEKLVEWVEWWLNHYPRKKLDGLSAVEVSAGA